jgi:hypothetical protein
MANDSELSRFNVMGANLLVELIHEEITPGGVILPAQRDYMGPVRARVVKLGEGRHRSENGYFEGGYPFTESEEDCESYDGKSIIWLGSPREGFELKLDGEAYRFVHVDSVIAWDSRS